MAARRRVTSAGEGTGGDVRAGAGVSMPGDVWFSQPLKGLLLPLFSEKWMDIHNFFPSCDLVYVLL